MTNHQNKQLKVCPIVARRTDHGFEILAFHHPEAGRQLVKGTVEAAETPREAACRELFEESGIVVDAKLIDLGQSSGIEQGQIWHFFLTVCPPVPANWTHHCKDDGGQDFKFFWQSAGQYLEDDWSPRYIRAIRYGQMKLQNLSPVQLDQYCPQSRPDIAETIKSLATKAGPEKSICPSEVARSMAGDDETKWRLLMKPIRTEAVILAKTGALRICRKGKAVDPDNFKGVYRLKTL